MIIEDKTKENYVGEEEYEGTIEDSMREALSRIGGIPKSTEPGAAVKINT